MKHKEIITTDVEIMLSEVTSHNYFICVLYFGNTYSLHCETMPGRGHFTLNIVISPMSDNF